MNTRLELVYYEAGQVNQYMGQAADTAVGVALADADLALREPLRPQLASLPVTAVDVTWLPAGRLPEGSRVYLANGTSRLIERAPASPPAQDPAKRPEVITEGDATRLAYDSYIREAASFLRSGLSVLIACDKIVVPHLARHIVLLSGQEPQVLDVPAGPAGQAEPPVDMRQAGPAASLRQRLLAQLRDLLQDITTGQVLVVTHLDLLGSGSDSSLANETRDLVDLLYNAEDRSSWPSLTRRCRCPRYWPRGSRPDGHRGHRASSGTRATAPSTDRAGAAHRQRPTGSLVSTRRTSTSTSRA